MDIAQSFPRLRSDLEARPTDVAGGRYVVDVTDPSSGKTFRLSDVEYFIATSMNGERDLAGLAALAETELGLQPSARELESVITTLAGLGYLDTTSPAPSIDDLTLGHAGGTMEETDSGMPAAADLELGLAGASDMDAPEEATYVAPALSLGRAGGPRMATGFPGVDEEDVPTAIKDPRRQSNAEARPSDPSIPPRPPSAGVEPTPSLTPVVTAADDEGPTNLPAPATDFDDEMSVDLTDHMKLGPETVKEAVRQSQMIQTVNPDDLLPPDERPSIPALGEPPSTPSTPALPPVPSVAEPVPEPSRGRDEFSADHLKPTELPAGRAHISRPVDVDADGPGARPVATAAPETTEQPSGQTAGNTSGSRAGLLVLLLLLVLVGAAAAVYFLDLFGVRARLGLEPANQGQKSDKPVTPRTQVTPRTDKPVKIVLPSATLATKDAPPVEVKADKPGVLVSIVASGTEVAEGDEIARFKGGEPYEKEIANTSSRLSYYEDKLAKAQASGKQSDIDKAQRKVEEKKALIEAAQSKLDAFIVRAPMAGVLETTLAANAKVAQDDVLASFPTAPLLIATFTVPADKNVAVGDEVEVASKADEKKRAGCQVAAVADQQVTVECPSNESLAAADEVVLP